MKKSAQTIQIETLLEQGYSCEDLARGLNVSLEAVKLIQAGLNKGQQEYKSFEERFKDVEQLAMDTLMQVAEQGENESARVASAKILLEQRAALKAKYEFNYEEIADRLERARSVSSRPKEIIEEGKIVEMVK